jgi:hypothetical protein
MKTFISIKHKVSNHTIFIVINHHLITSFWNGLQQNLNYTINLPVQTSIIPTQIKIICLNIQYADFWILN